MKSAAHSRRLLLFNEARSSLRPLSPKPFSRLNIQARELRQLALARVERAKVGCAQYQRRRHMQNVQTPAAQRGCVLLRQPLGFLNQFFPQVGFGYQQTRS